MGSSSSKATSDQEANAFLSQQFVGSCDVTCDNYQEGTTVDLINTTLSGGIHLGQKCTVDGACAITGLSGATTDVLFKAANSSNAKNASNFFAGAALNFDGSEASSRQAVDQEVRQLTTEKCHFGTLNQMKDVTVYAENSRIDGGIGIDQEGKTSGTCQLRNNLSAAAAASGMASNTAKSGKDKKGEKKGGNAALVTVGVVVVVVVALIFGSRMIGSGSRKDALVDATKLASMAKAVAGCKKGKPVANPISGIPIIDPSSKGPVCPP